MQNVTNTTFSTTPHFVKLRYCIDFSRGFTFVTFLICLTSTVIFIFSKDGKNYQLSPPRDVCVFDWLTSLRVRQIIYLQFQPRVVRLGLLSAKKKKNSFLMFTDFARLPSMFTLTNCVAGSEDKAIERGRLKYLFYFVIN